MEKLQAASQKLLMPARSLASNPGPSGSPGKIVSRGGSTSIGLWKTLSGCCTEGLEKAMAGCGAGDDGSPSW